MKVNYMSKEDAEIILGGYKRCKLQKVVEDFVESGNPAAVIDFDPTEYRDANSLCGSIRACIRRYHMDDTVCCMVRDKKVFLLRRDLMNIKL